MGGGEQASGVLRRRLGTVAEDRLADIFVMGVAGLDLLRDRVHVAKAAFELVGAEYGGGAGHVVGPLDHRERLGNGAGPRPGEPHLRLVCQGPPRCQMPPTPSAATDKES